MIYRPLRGGSCISDSWNLRTSYWFRYLPVDRCRYSGFRLIVRRQV